MRQIYKDTIVGLILASFTFSPTAFSAPTGQKAKVQKRPVELQFVDRLKEDKGNLRLSSIVEASKPMVKKTVYRELLKSSQPFWDKKIQKLKIGKRSLKLKMNGKTVSVRYVKKGDVAFLVNKKKVLWKDLKTFRTARAKVYEILTGKKLQRKKISFLDRMMESMSFVTEAFACSFETASGKARCSSDCSAISGASLDLEAQVCRCGPGTLVHLNNRSLGTDVIENFAESGAAARLSCRAPAAEKPAAEEPSETCPVDGSAAKVSCKCSTDGGKVYRPGQTCPARKAKDSETKKSEKKRKRPKTDPSPEDDDFVAAAGGFLSDNWPIVLAGAVGIGFLLLVLLSDDDDDDEAAVGPQNPLAGWRPEPENDPCLQTDGARGQTRPDHCDVSSSNSNSAGEDTGPLF